MPLVGVFGAAARDPNVLAGFRVALTRMSSSPFPSHQVYGESFFAVSVASPATLVSSQGIVVAFEGKLFELESLAATLSLSQAADLTPGALFLAAYLRWGSDLMRYLDGEFSAAVFDAGHRRLLLVRDVMGRGSIHYIHQGKALLFATEPLGLFALPGVTARPNATWFAGLAILKPVTGQTGFEGVLFPAAGHLLLAQGDAAPRVVRCWHPEQQPQLHLRRWSEYAQALHAAMQRAVELRLPSQGLVAAELSAGYDSSAVTALAANALARQNRPLIAYTAVPSHASDGSKIVKYGIANEWPLASTLVARHSNIEHVAVPTGGRPWLPAIDGMTEFLAGPPFFIRNLSWMYAARCMAQERGVSHILNGQNGNLAGSYDGAFALFDMRRRGRWRAWLRTAQQWHSVGAGWRSLLMHTWLPSHATRTRLRMMLGRPRKEFAEYSLIRPDFLHAAGVAVPLASTLGGLVDGDRTNGAARRLSIMRMVDFGGQYAVERRRFQLQRSDPTADRTLVELCLSFPDEVFCPGGERRALYREAMRQTLPQELLQKTGFGVQAADFLQNFKEGMPEWWQVLEAAEQSSAITDCLDVPRLRSLLQSFDGDTRDTAEKDTLYNYTVGGALALARFLQQFPAEAATPIRE